MIYNLLLYMGIFFIVGGFSLWLYSEHKLREIDIQLFKLNQKIEELGLFSDLKKKQYFSAYILNGWSLIASLLRGWTQK